MAKNIALTFTCRGRERVLRDGGSGDWTIDPGRALDNVEFVVCCQNLNPKRSGDDWGSATHKHGEGFIVGRVVDVVQVETAPGKKNRFRFIFSEYAEIDVDGMWGKERFPVRYMHEKELPFDIQSLDFRPIPKFKSEDRTFNLEEAKAALALQHEIKVNQVKIVL